MPEDDTIFLVKSLGDTTFGIAYAAPVGAGAVLLLSNLELYKLFKLRQF